jgi:hypothetical protein
LKPSETDGGHRLPATGQNLFSPPAEPGGEEKAPATGDENCNEKRETAACPILAGGRWPEAGSAEGAA